MSLKSCVLLCMPLLLAGIPCAQAGQDAARSTAKGTVHIDVYESSEELHESMQEKIALQFGAARSQSPTISVDDSREYQQMDGFGASLTDSSAWLLWRKLTESQRKEALEKLFDQKKGIGLDISEPRTPNWLEGRGTISLPSHRNYNTYITLDKYCRDRIIC